MATADQYLGLTKKGAQNKAEAENLIFRLIRIDNENYLDYPEESYDGRICVEIEDGKVVKATIQ